MTQSGAYFVFFFNNLNMTRGVFTICWSVSVELKYIMFRSSSIITYHHRIQGVDASARLTDSVLCASEDCAILQSIWNTSIAPTRTEIYLLTYSHSHAKALLLCSDRVPAFSRQALTLLWTHYVKELATLSSVPDYVLTVYHTRLVTVPWKGFFPDMDAIEMMLKVWKASLIHCSAKMEELAGKCRCEMYGLERRCSQLFFSCLRSFICVCV